MIERTSSRRELSPKVVILLSRPALRALNGTVRLMRGGETFRTLLREERYATAHGFLWQQTLPEEQTKSITARATDPEGNRLEPREWVYSGLGRATEVQVQVEPRLARIRQALGGVAAPVTLAQYNISSSSAHQFVPALVEA